MPYSRDEWEEVKPFMDEVFVEIDRPNEQLFDVSVGIRGDGGPNVDASWGRDLTPAQMQSLALYAAEVLRRFAEDWTPPPLLGDADEDSADR
jgi:hypothetical protein